MFNKNCLSILTLSCLFCTACASMGGSDPTLEQRVAQQDMQLRQMQPQQADAWNQIQAMRQEINELRGQLKDLNRTGATGTVTGSMGQSDNTIPLNPDYADPMASAQTRPPVPTDGLSGSISPSGAPDSSAYGAARATTPVAVPMTGAAGQNAYGLPPDTSPAQTAEAVQAPSESTWGQADPKPEVQVPQKDLSLALFDAGVNSYNARNYDAAERSFKDFLANYPNHTQSAEAQYYLAECMFQKNQFPEAALAYDTVIKKYPKSSSAPGAYLKQAICFSKMKQPAAAKARMQEIINKFPNSPEAARAKSFLKTNK